MCIYRRRTNNHKNLLLLLQLDGELREGIILTCAHATQHNHKFVEICTFGVYDHIYTWLTIVVMATISNVPILFVNIA